MVSAGADPMLRSRDGSTARDWAAKFGHTEVADFLDSHMQVTAGSLPLQSSLICTRAHDHCSAPCLLPRSNARQGKGRSGSKTLEPP